MALTGTYYIKDAQKIMHRGRDFKYLLYLYSRQNKTGNRSDGLIMEQGFKLYIQLIFHRLSSIKSIISLMYSITTLVR